MEALVLFLTLFGVVAALIMAVTALLLFMDTLHGNSNKPTKHDRD